MQCEVLALAVLYKNKSIRNLEMWTNIVEKIDMQHGIAFLLIKINITQNYHIRFTYAVFGSIFKRDMFQQLLMGAPT